MDTLDTLRDGGRVVGLVSHVPELRNRIPTQLRGPQGRRGSDESVSPGDRLTVDRGTGTASDRFVP